MAESVGFAAKVSAVHRALVAAALPHAFGGAIALAYAVLEVRNTIDVDINVFVPESASDVVLAALPSEIEVTTERRDLLLRDGQVRLRWGLTPIDVFLSTTPFHEDAAKHARVVPLGDEEIPVLAPMHLAVFKTLFNRPKDYIDIASMVAANSFDVATTRDEIARLLGEDADELQEFDRAVVYGRNSWRES